MKFFGFPIENIKIKGHRGTWHLIEVSHFQGINVYLLEHETYGNEVPHLIVDKDFNIILGDVWNGFQDLYN